jgi:hypothetical protein
MKEITPDEMYGIAKKFNHEMDELPIETHSAIVELIRVGRDHRNIQMQRADAERREAEQKAAQERAYEMQQKQLAQNQAILEADRQRRLQTAPPEVLTPQ